MPGSTPATSQLDWLISTTALIVLSWSNATRDLIKACPGAGRGRSAGASGHSVSYLPATMVPSPSPPAPYHLSAGRPSAVPASGSARRGAGAVERGGLEIRSGRLSHTPDAEIAGFVGDGRRPGVWTQDHVWEAMTAAAAQL